MRPSTQAAVGIAAVIDLGLWAFRTGEDEVNGLKLPDAPKAK